MAIPGIQKFTKDERIAHILESIEHCAKRHHGCADDQKILKNDLDFIAEKIAELRLVMSSTRNEYFY